MSTTYENIYSQQIFLLAKTMVIKDILSAQAVNKELRLNGISVNENLPEEWKYYKHLAGEYHFTDDAMEVISLDTLLPIAFTKENLQFHRATAKGYAYGGQYFAELERRYPTQRTLMLGILNPIDKQTAISAANGTILYYDDSLVESNEYELIPKLQQFIDRYMARWYLTAYAVSDDLYTAAQLGNLVLKIPSAIRNIRKSHCHTDQVHSFHIRQYLASHNGLDQFLDLLTKEQALFLYRNINYIRKNAGKQETFLWLVDKILTKRGFPISKFHLRHNTLEMPEEIYPSVELIRTPINLINVEGRDDIFSVRQILEREVPLAPGNIEIIDESEQDIINAVRSAKYNQYPTKVLESVVYDTTQEGPYQLPDVLLNNWLYLSSYGRYQGVVRVVNPATSETITVSAQDAFVLFLYAFSKSRGMDTSVIPVVEAINVPILPPPNFETLRSMCDRELVSDGFIKEVMGELPAIGVYLNAETFYDIAVSIHDRMRTHRLQHSSIDHNVARGQVEGICNRHYGNIPCQLAATGQTYDQWLNDRGLNLDGLSAFDFDILSVSIVAVATGTDSNQSKSLSELHRGMLRLMERLSSYTVQFIQTINTEPVIVTDMPTINLGNLDIELSIDIIAMDNYVDLEKVDATLKVGYDVEPGLTGDDIDLNVRPLILLDVDGIDDLNFEVNYSTVIGIECGLDIIGADVVYGGFDSMLPNNVLTNYDVPIVLPNVIRNAILDDFMDD